MEEWVDKRSEERIRNKVWKEEWNIRNKKKSRINGR